jgi:hypothetical protein
MHEREPFAPAQVRIAEFVLIEAELVQDRRMDIAQVAAILDGPQTVVVGMDFSDAVQPIDGLYPYLRAVRDLASGKQLLWSPVRSPSAEEAILALRLLRN